MRGSSPVGAPLLLAPVLLAASLGRACWAKLVGAVVVPHGDFAYDPALVNGTGGATELHEAALEAGRFAAELRPDVIFLSTPHGLELGEAFLLYLNTNLSGVAPLGDVPHSVGPQSVALNLTTDTGLASRLLDGLRGAGHRVEGLQGFSDSQPLPISWGEILPMTYVAAVRAPPSPVVVLGMPLRRFNHSAEMVGELLRLGRFVARFLEEHAGRAVWMVSSDLAHTHLASGPYGYCPCAQPFDDAVGRWARDMNSSSLLVDATENQRLGAASCGFTGLVALEGALQEVGRGEWRPSLLANAHPTYYGMLVATYQRLFGGQAHHTARGPATLMV